MPSQNDLNAALDDILALYVDADSSVCQAHTAYLDEENQRVVVIVPQKKIPAALSIRESIPKWLNGNVRVKVFQGEQPKNLLLKLEPGHLHSQAVTNHRKCHSPLVMGGAQIQPAGANWVGTLGCMVMADGKVAAITNAHVSGLRGGGKRMGQPSSQGSYFSTIQRVFPINFGSGASNTIDLALLDGRGADGKHRVTPHQTDIAGRLGKEWKDVKSGMEVVKSGRTTGVTQGKCVGTKGVSHVSYDEGTARFTDLDIYRASGGSFSAAGDSGSAILEAGTSNFLSLLFAGGGGTTLGCAARNVMSAINGQMYQG